MDHRALRRQAWKLAGENRGRMVIVLALSMLPSLTGAAAKGLSYTPIWLMATLWTAGALLAVGAAQAGLLVSAGEKLTAAGVLGPYQKGRIGKTAAIVLSLWSITWLSGWPCSWVAALAADSRDHIYQSAGHALFLCISLLGSFLLTMFVRLCLFPVQYCYLLNPERRVGGLLRTGAALGLHNLDFSFLFLCGLYLPVAAVGAICLVMGLAGALPFSLLLAGLQVFYLLVYFPYAVTAQALFVRRLMEWKGEGAGTDRHETGG